MNTVARYLGDVMHYGAHARLFWLSLPPTPLFRHLSSIRRLDARHHHDKRRRQGRASIRYARVPFAGWRPGPAALATEAFMI